MSWESVANVAAGILLLAGASLCLAAAVGLVRFPDVLSRMHSATKPQTLGLLLIVLGVGLVLRTWSAWGILSLVFVMQLFTAPVAAHMVGRAAYRSGQVDEDRLLRDELAEALRRAEDDPPEK